MAKRDRKRKGKDPGAEPDDLTTSQRVHLERDKPPRPRGLRLYLVRHGPADEPNATVPDRERRLSPKGLRRTLEAARGLKALGVRPRAVLTSPLVRAVQTAKLLAQELGVPAAAVRASASLEPGAEPAAALEAVRELGRRRVVCVGHSPGLDVLLGWLVTGQAQALGELKRAGAACVEVFPEGRPQLMWVLGARALRLAARR